jgi:hypothetical protein
MLGNEGKNRAIQITRDCTKIPTSFGKLVSFVPLNGQYHKIGVFCFSLIV